MSRIVADLVKNVTQQIIAALSALLLAVVAPFRRRVSNDMTFGAVAAAA